MGLTTDPNDPGLRKIEASGQQATYLVLSEEERAKGFVRPVRTKYVHLRCGVVTSMGLALSETYAREPHFYGGTFCVGCRAHFPLRDHRPEANSVDGWAFVWDRDGEPVGSDAEEAAAFRAVKADREAEKNKGGGI